MVVAVSKKRDIERQHRISHIMLKCDRFCQGGFNGTNSSELALAQRHLEGHMQIPLWIVGFCRKPCTFSWQQWRIRPKRSSARW